VKDKKLKTKGESITMHATDTDLMVTKMKDRKVFMILTTAHTTTPTLTGKRDHQDRPIIKPECVHYYNLYMNAVDRSDQMVSNYPTPPKVFGYSIDPSLSSGMVWYHRYGFKHWLTTASNHYRLIRIRKNPHKFTL
jgi:hypothetical protein